MRRPEQDLQRDVADLLDKAGFLWCHVPNGGGRSRTEAAIMAGMGVKRGVPDILIFRPKIFSRESVMLFGVAIELKAGKGKETPEQKYWAQELTNAGWLVQTCRSLGEVIGVLQHIKWLRTLP